MKKFFTVLLFSALTNVYSQNNNRVETKLSTNLDFTRVTIEISGLNNKGSKINFNVFNIKGKKVKSITLPEFDKSITASISIEDIEFGEYSYTITKDNKRLSKGKFIKDSFDIL